jgi:hypothetical protein
MQEAIDVAREWLQNSRGETVSKRMFGEHARTDVHVLLRGHAILASDVRTVDGGKFHAGEDPGAMSSWYQLLGAPIG